MNDRQQSGTMFHGKFHARIERLKRYSAGSKLGRQRKAQQIRKRVMAIGDKAVKK